MKIAVHGYSCKCILFLLDGLLNLILYRITESLVASTAVIGHSEYKMSFNLVLRGVKARLRLPCKKVLSRHQPERCLSYKTFLLSEWLIKSITDLYVGKKELKNDHSEAYSYNFSQFNRQVVIH